MVDSASMILFDFQTEIAIIIQVDTLQLLL